LIKKKILLTGTSGFIGQKYLVNALSKNYTVIDILRYKNINNRKLNKIRFKYPKKYKSIYYNKYNQIKKLLKNQKFECFINFATLYKNDHNFNEIPKFIASNITFPSMILDVIYKNTKKIINFGSMMQHLDGINYLPKNFYASTKSSLEMILKFYSQNNIKLKVYDLKLYESFSRDDKRNKLIPILIKNYSKNVKTLINSKNLELNILHVNDIIQAINIILEKNIKSGSYCLKQKKNIRIKNLIDEINKNKKKKIKVEYLGHKITKIPNSRIKTLQKWEPKHNVKEEIIREFI
jgi:nucleoside-diphosphate-sugar epimerase